MSIIEYLMNVDDADIDTIASYIDWDEVSQLRLEEPFLSKYNEYINWQYYDRETFFTEEFIRQYPHYMDWEYISKYQNLSEDLIRDCGDYIIWEYICIPCMDNERYYKFYDVHEMMGWMHRDYLKIFQKIEENYQKNLLENFRMRSIGILYLHTMNYLINSTEISKIN